MESRPNIILFELAHQVHPVEGVLFEHMYASCPSRDAIKTTLLTGLHPRVYEKRKGFPNLLDALVDNGYSIDKMNAPFFLWYSNPTEDEVNQLIASLDDNTIAVFLQKDGIKTPILWSWPGHFAHGVTKGIASHIDFAPTILDLCGIPIPVSDILPSIEYRNQVVPWPGKSLKEQLFGRVEKVNDYAIVEDGDMRMFITERYKLTLYVGKKYGKLYDLQIDPLEQKNLWDDPGYHDAIMDLKAQFLNAFILQGDSTARVISPFA